MVQPVIAISSTVCVPYRCHYFLIRVWEILRVVTLVHIYYVVKTALPTSTPTIFFGFDWSQNRFHRKFVNKKSRVIYFQCRETRQFSLGQWYTKAYGYERQIFKITVVFHTRYLWNKVASPNLFAFLTQVTHYLTALKIKKNLSTGKFSCERR